MFGVRIPLRLLPYLGAILLWISFSKYELGVFGLVALVPYLFFVRGYQQKSISTKQFILHTWLSSLVFNLALLFWMMQTRPEIWTSISGTPLVAGQLMMWIICSLAYSVAALIMALGIVLCRKISVEDWRFVLLFPALWTLADYLRGYVFSSAVWNTPGAIGPYWTYGTLGLSITTTPLGYLSRYLGLYGMSFLGAAIGVVLFWFWTKNHFKVSIAIVGAILALTASAYWIYKTPNGTNIKAAVVHLPAATLGATPEVMQRLALDFGDEDPPNVLLFPEYSLFFSFPQATTQPVLDAIFRGQPGAVITAGGEHPAQDGYKSNRIVYRESTGKVISVQEKTLLAPAGEYLTGFHEAAFRLIGRGDVVDKFNSHRLVEKGRMPEYPVTVNGIRYGDLSCSGVISPAFYQKLSRQGAEILTSNSSLGIFIHAPLHGESVRQMARFNAIANAKPFIQATHGGESYVIDANGNFVKRVTEDTSQIAAGNVTTNHILTPYSRFGEWTVAVSLLTILAIFFAQRSEVPLERPRRAGTPSVQKPQHKLF